MSTTEPSSSLLFKHSKINLTGVDSSLENHFLVFNSDNEHMICLQLAVEYDFFSLFACLQHTRT